MMKKRWASLKITFLLLLLTACSGGTPRPQSSIQATDPDLVSRWEEVEAALAGELLYLHPPGEVLCEWEILGDSGVDVYIWAVCFGLPPAGRSEAYVPRASTPAVISLGADGSILGVAIPAYGASYAEGVRELFPADIQALIFDRAANIAEMAAHAEGRRETTGPPLIVLADIQP